ncbi:MAG TPA: hypothetical protein V6C81_16680 [Planktothrix sp.]|jgi:hypothetical protein
MYKPKKYIKLDSLSAMPSLNDCKNLLIAGNKSKGCLVEQPFKSEKTNTFYSLTVKIETGGKEPVWTLYEGEGNQSRVVWSSPFSDIHLMNDVLHLSLPGETGVWRSEGGDADIWKSDSNQAGGDGEGAQGEEVFATDQRDLVPRPDQGPAFFSGGAEFNGNTGPNVQLPAYPSPVITPVTPTVAKEAPAPEPPQPVAPAPDPIYPPPQPGYPYPPGYPAPPYGAYPPGYPYPPPYPPYGYPGYPPPGGYMPGYPQPVDPNMYRAQSVPVQGGAPSAPASYEPMAQMDPELLRKGTNLMLGSILTEAGLIPESTLMAALRLQEMVKTGMIKTSQAAEAVRRAHERGGSFDPSFFTTAAVPVDPKDAVTVAPPLGTILVEAGLIGAATLKAALSLQSVVRSGAMTKEDALTAFIKEHFGAEEKPEAKKEREAEQTIDLLKEGGLISAKDVMAARAVKQRHGGNISKILVAAGKLDLKTFEAATTCRQLLKEDRLKLEQVMVVLNYCQRSRMTFEEAIDELGWDTP